ncbi:MAG: DUF4349 domain-containing protein [Clostridia bacterium]|nr:DUF4349 domain-containing protein [Clostridia bacterium]
MAVHQPVVPTIKRPLEKGRIFIAVLLLFSLLVLLAGGCGAATKAAQDAAAPMEMELAVPESETRAGYANLIDSYASIEAALIDRKVIRNADINISVKDIQEATRRVTQMLTAAGGIVSDSSIYRDGDRLQATMQLRLPANRFEEFILELEELGEITHQRIYSEDVTEEFIDLEAKIKNLESQEETLR